MINRLTVDSPAQDDPQNLFYASLGLKIYIYDHL